VKLCSMFNLFRSGAFSIVHAGTDLETGDEVAIKTIEKKFMDRQTSAMLAREIEISKRVDHEHVLKLLAIYETQSSLHLVTEL
jgi:serine/threonine protein kinase